MTERAKHIAQRAVAILFWVAVWLVAARFVDNDILLAGPLDTLAALGANLASAGFWEAVASSGACIVAVSVASAAVGAAAGLLAARFKAVELLVAPLVHIMKSAPVACVAVILLVVLGSRGAIAAIVAFVALPPFYVAAMEASRTRDREAAHAFSLMGATKLQVFLAITWPASLPLFQAAAKTAMALSWRAGVTGELLGIPLGSIGAAVYTSKLTLDTAGLLAWTIVVMLCGWLCERAAVGLIRLTRHAPRLAVSLSRRRGNRRRGSGAPAPAATAEVGPAPKPAATAGPADTASVAPAPADPVAPAPVAQAVPAPKPVEILFARRVSKSLAGRDVLRDVSLSLGAGDRVCLMAPTGTGKTTLLNVLCAFDAPDGGEVLCPRPCAVVRQRSCLIEGLTAIDNVMLVAAPCVPRVGEGHVPAFLACACEREVAQALDSLLPEGSVRKLAGELSGGTRRLVEIARAVLSPGRALVLDEPFSGLDPQAKERVCAFITANLGDRPLLVATHDARDAELLGARIVRLGN